MTLEKLNGHLALLNELENDLEMRRALLGRANPGASALTGMPRSSNVGDKVGNLGAELGDIDLQIERIRDRIKHSEAEILPFIQSIQDTQTRMIFRLRFLRGLSWNEVARCIGGRNTEKSVSMMCYRYLGII